MQIDDSWYQRPPGLRAHESAGGVIVRLEGAWMQVALVREGGRPAYVLPKGHVEPGESLEAAARREIAEESGLRNLVLLGPLGVRERLAFDRSSWKITHYFLFLAPASPGGDAPGSEGELAWFPLDALPAMFWPEQRDLLTSARERIRAAVARHLVQHQFARRAGAYARRESHAGDQDLRVLVDHLQPRPGERVLDVATGTGFTAFALAAAGASVVGVDLTVQMLQEGRRLGPEAAIHWVVGDAGALPFGTGTFDAVTVRRAPHHFPDLGGALAEMTRVLRPGGRLGIVDQAAPEDEGGRALMEHLEKLRDPSHVEAHPPTRWRRLVEDLGVDISFAGLVQRRLTIDDWLAPAGVDPARQQAIEDALGRASPEVRTQIGDDGSEPRSFTRRWVVLVGTKR